jgi:phage-related protein
VSGKPLFWLGSALDDVRGFPAEARRQAGHELYQVQLGLPPGDWRPMPSVGSGVAEIRIHTDVEHRVLYVAKFAEGVYVLHAFEKRTQQTRRADLDLARRRLADLRRLRREAAAGRPRRDRHGNEGHEGR